MKIKELYASFTGQINVGKFAFFINVDLNGVEINIDELITQCTNFSHIVIIGEPFTQNEELSKFIKKLTKQNQNITFEIFSKGTIKPRLIGPMKNIVYNVNVQLKHTMQDYEKRIKENVINWFNIIGANFLFDIKNKDDIDETKLLVKQLGIPKIQVYLSITGEADQDQLDMIIRNAKISGYNFTLDYCKIFWPEVGRDKKEGEE